MGAKLYFYYSAMNAGKSASLLQSSHNYKERGMKTKLFIPKIIGIEFIKSRIGLSCEAFPFDAEFDFFEYAKTHYMASGRNAVPSEEEQAKAGGLENVSCIMIDEAQFMTKAQVKQLSDIVDIMDIPVLCYGLRSDFQGEPFEGSKYLLCQADALTEIKAICECGRKAIMNQRVDQHGNAVVKGAQIEVGGNDRYIGRCRKHFWSRISEAEKNSAKEESAEILEN